MKEKRTFEILLLGRTIKLKIESPGSWSEAGMGRADELRGEILLRDGMSEDSEKGTLIHELLHLISGINGLDLTEAQVGTISAGFFSFLKHNDELVARIIDSKGLAE